MRPLSGQFSIVVVGRWNPFIFSPEWVKKNLIDTANETDHPITLAYPLNDPDAPSQLKFDGIQLLPGRSRLDIKPDDLTLDAMCHCGDVITKCLQLLSHTPVGALGINFSFEETNNPESLVTAVTFQDAVNIDSNMFHLGNSEIYRSFSIADEIAKLNLRLNIGEPPFIDFNFEMPISNTNEALEHLSTDRISSFYHKAINFAQSVYGLTMDEEEKENE